MVLDIVILFAVLGISYYSTLLIYNMRRGQLEKSWRYMSYGALIATCGSVILFMPNFVVVSASSSALANYIGLLLTGIGTIFVMLGFRSHYMFWNPKEIRESAKRAKKMVLNFKGIRKESKTKRPEQP